MKDDDKCNEDQIIDECHACDETGHIRLSDKCIYYRNGYKTRPITNDARKDGKAAPNIFKREPIDIRKEGDKILIKIGNEEFTKGIAYSFGDNNCLIHTIQQVSQAKPDYQQSM